MCRRMRHLKPREIQGCDIAFDFSRPETLYDATSGGSLVAADGAIARSEDISGGTNHATQSTSGSRPQRKVAYVNGMDVALFDGSADYLSAGDAADLLDKPIEMLTVSRRTGGSAAFQNVFSKSRAAAADGRWGHAVLDVDTFICTKTNSGDTADKLYAQASTASTALQVLHGHAGRDTGANQATAFLRRNAEQVGAIPAPQTDTGASVNTADLVFMGAYQSTTGGAPPFASSYLTGYIGEAAKWSVAFSTALRLRLEHSRMRKWRING